jgi:hypothetical protein
MVVDDCGDTKSVQRSTTHGMWEFLFSSHVLNTTAITMSAEYSISNRLYNPTQLLNDQCMLSFDQCVTVPFLHTMISAWKGWDGIVTNTNILKTRIDIESRMPELSCFLQSIDSDSSKMHDPISCGTHVTNEGLSHETTQSYTYLIRIGGGSGITLSAINATLRIVHTGIRLKGTPSAINDALSDVSYVGKTNWNTRMYGHDVVELSVIDTRATSTKSIGHMRSTENIMIEVLAVNDAPSVTVPIDTTVSTEDFTRVISGIRVNDVDASESYSSFMEISFSTTIGSASLPLFSQAYGSHHPVFGVVQLMI